MTKDYLTLQVMINGQCINRFFEENHTLTSTSEYHQFGQGRDPYPPDNPLRTLCSKHTKHPEDWTVDKIRR
ncbi:hypothetical protein TSAR_006786 [Trichomalopsis sarcophagae]|uniref:Uncharacterized protein n=1 Tax=Trichomalopsis sarcophagae TaxID=543379 RepID=A0A232FMV8_9HYME|nr:hypothetical protein TSAR_006786 [Trichomalopsis sarcophagae]